MSLFVAPAAVSSGSSASIIRRRVVSLERRVTGTVVVALLEAPGFRDMNMVRRSTRKDRLPRAPPLRRRGTSLRRARASTRRSIGREDVQAARHDVSRYSSQMAVLIGNGDCVREARSEANLTNEAPVLLYAEKRSRRHWADAGFGATNGHRVAGIRRRVLRLRRSGRFAAGRGGERAASTRARRARAVERGRSGENRGIGRSRTRSPPIPQAS